MSRVHLVRHKDQLINIANLDQIGLRPDEDSLGVVFIAFNGSSRIHTLEFTSHKKAEKAFETLTQDPCITITCIDEDVLSSDDDDEEEEDSSVDEDAETVVLDDDDEKEKELVGVSAADDDDVPIANKKKRKATSTLSTSPQSL